MKAKTRYQPLLNINVPFDNALKKALAVKPSPGVWNNLRKNVKRPVPRTGEKVAG